MPLPKIYLVLKNRLAQYMGATVEIWTVRADGKKSCGKRGLQALRMLKTL